MAQHLTGTANKPNVLILFTDDQGTLDVNCYGAADLQTFNLDKLAASGVRFTQAYAHTVCCPSRAALLTGRQPQRSGVGNWLQNDRRDENSGLGNMDAQAVTLAEVLKAAGYDTALFGKWHLGHSEENNKGISVDNHSSGYPKGHYYLAHDGGGYTGKWIGQGDFPGRRLFAFRPSSATQRHYPGTKCAIRWSPSWTGFPRYLPCRRTPRSEGLRAGAPQHRSPAHRPEPGLGQQCRFLPVEPGKVVGGQRGSQCSILQVPEGEGDRTLRSHIGDGPGLVILNFGSRSNGDIPALRRMG